MLLSFQDKLALRVAPAGVALSVARRSWQPVATEPISLTVTTTAEPVESAVLGAVCSILQDCGSNKGRVDVLLSDQFVRYVIVPWVPTAYRPEDDAALAGICLSECFGIDPHDWEIRISSGPYGQARVACAVKASLLKGLCSAIEASDLRVGDIRPEFVEIFNRSHAQLQDRNHVMLAVVEGPQCLLATIEDGHWRSVRTLRLGRSSSAETLRCLVEREAVLQGIGTNTAVYVRATKAAVSDKEMQAFGWQSLDVPTSRPSSPIERIAALGEVS